MYISNHFFWGVLYKDATFDAGEKEQLLELNEANHVYGSHAELDVKAYDSYCTTQRDRFRYLEVPWSEEGRVWVVWWRALVDSASSLPRTVSHAKRWTLRHRSSTLTQLLLSCIKVKFKCNDR